MACSNICLHKSFLAIAGAHFLSTYMLIFQVKKSTYIRHAALRGKEIKLTRIISDIGHHLTSPLILESNTYEMWSITIDGYVSGKKYFNVLGTKDKI